jgi:aldehyde:ferredoxin oxidoreductase
LGANCGIFDLDKIAYLNRLCDDYGLDTIETGDAIAVAMEAGLLPFGDAEGAANLLHEVANQSALGRIIANGVIFTGKAFGVTRIPAVKGQGIPAYDPRALKGTGVTYLTSPMGADHTAGNCLPGVGGLDTLKPEGQVALSKKLQVSVAVYDTVGMCTFAGGAVGERCEVIAELLSGYLDEHVSPEDVLAMGRDVIKMEIEFNRKSGLMVPQTRYLEFFTTEPLPPKDTVFDVPYHEIDQIFDA